MEISLLMLCFYAYKVFVRWQEHQRLMLNTSDKSPEEGYSAFSEKICAGCGSLILLQTHRPSAERLAFQSTQRYNYQRPFVKQQHRHAGGVSSANPSRGRAAGQGHVGMEIPQAQIPAAAPATTSLVVWSQKFSVEVVTVK